MTEREQLEQAIAALEAQRALLGDGVVEAGLAPMRRQLATLIAPPTPEERKLVTVLFADVSGFTAMMEHRDPEEVREIINTVWARIDGAILRHGGRIDKHIGDAVMALFGTPRAQEDDPERAILAALAMQAELRALAGTADGVPVQMRIGINTGRVLLGPVGTTNEYTALGDAVNLASRLEHAAPVGGILIAHDTYRHVQNLFDVQALPPLTVRGKTEPVQTYLVERARPRTFYGSPRGIAGLETPLVGRDSELGTLQAALEGVLASGQAQIITITGEAGMGKSRLLAEFEGWVDHQPGLIWYFKGRARQETSTLPYALIRDLFALRFGIVESDPAAVAREKLEAGVRAIMGQAGVVPAHFLGHLIGLDFSDSPHLRGILEDTRQVRDRAFHYAGQFFRALVGERPAVVMLEDIHWADDSSLDLLEYLGRTARAVPLLVLHLARPTLLERRPAWGAGHLYIELHPLSPEDSHRLVTGLLGKLPAIPPALPALVVRSAEGNPYYMEELIKMLIDDGVIRAGAGAWEVAPERLTALHVPPTLTGVLQARLDGLPLVERETLQRAAVVGRVFWDDTVARLQESGDHTETRLGALQGKELIFGRAGSTFAGAREYLFKHALLRDVTYESVLLRHRRAYHAAVAAWLEERSGERAGELAGLIADHYERAGVAERAGAWYARAGRQAQATFAAETAIAYYQKALARLPIDEGYAAARLAAYEGLGDMLQQQAHAAEAVAVYQAMEAAAAAAGDGAAQARAWYGLSGVQQSQGDPLGALESADHAEGLARQAGADLELTNALWRKGWALYRLGSAQEALALGEEALIRAADLGATGVEARCLNLLGAIHALLGQAGEAAAYQEQALALFRARGDRRGVGMVSNNLGNTAHLRGDHAGAVALISEALDVAREIGDRSREMVYLSNLGAARVGLEEYAAAEADLRQAIEQGEAAGGAGFLSEAYRALAEALLGQGRPEAAEGAARLALARGKEAGRLEHLGGAWRVLGQVAARQAAPLLIDDHAYDAAACFAQSERIYTARGMAGERARTLRAWAAHDLAQGDHAAGLARWEEARALFAHLDMTPELARMTAPPDPPDTTST